MAEIQNLSSTDIQQIFNADWQRYQEWLKR